MNHLPLQIPLKFRALKGGKTGHGCFVKCNKKSKFVSDKCCMTGLKINTCKFPENHRFVSMKYNPIIGKTRTIKTYPKELRDFKEYYKLHKIVMESHSFGNNLNIKESKPLRLIECEKMYLDFKNGFEDGEKMNEYEFNSISKMEIDRITNYLKKLNDSLRQNNINPEFFLVADFKKEHVRMFDSFISKYAPKTYNNIISSIKTFFNYLIKRKGYDIENRFSVMLNKHTESRKETISEEEFNKLLTVIKEENGVQSLPKAKGGFTNRNFYFDWLKDAYCFALYTGCRRPELSSIKVKDVDLDNNIVTITDSKISRKKKHDVIRIVSIIPPLLPLLKKLIEDKPSEQYLIAPHFENRTRLETLLTKSFSHFQNLINSSLTFGCLRNTYSTIMISKLGENFFGATGLHADIETTKKHYVNKKELARQSNIESFWN